MNIEIIKEKFIEWEKEISSEESWEQTTQEINKCESINDIINYYMIDREWEGNQTLVKHLLLFTSTLI